MSATAWFVVVGALLIAMGVMTRYIARLPLTTGFAPALFVVVRPLAVAVGAPTRGAPRIQRRLTMWFGIRGIGSMYYLTYAIGHGLPPALAERLAGLTISVIVASLVVHGVSVPPLMRRYKQFVDARVRRVPAVPRPR